MEDLGKFFSITNAIKGDRGFLDCKQQFKIDSKKISESKRPHRLGKIETDQLEDFSITGKTICSTNFLNMTIIHEDFADCLFDMETYDFFDICRLNQSAFGCIRFVTDYVLPLNGEEDISAQRKFLLKHLKEIQKTEPFCEPWKKLDKKARKIEDIKVLKKFVRLRLSHEFKFLFHLNINGNEIPGEYYYQKDNVEKLHRHLSKAFVAKLEEVFVQNKDLVNEYKKFLLETQFIMENDVYKKFKDG